MIDKQGFVEEIDFNELQCLEVVGRGAFGVVHRAQWRDATVAVKLIETEAERKAFITELKQLSRISHANIVHLYGACTKQPVCLVMEFAEGGSLYNVLHCAKHLSYTAAHAVSWARQCALGVEYLHGMKPKPLIHRDLKPPNLLLVNGGTKLKICDFGTACDQRTHMTNNKGSAAWMAPEVFEGSNYSEKCDVFSWGIILWEVITRHKPFEEIGGSAFRVMWAVHSGKRPPIVRSIPRPLDKLMTRCWSANPRERPSMSEVVRVMNHFSKFFKGENEPLYITQYNESDDLLHLDRSIVGLHAVDSRCSTVRETMRLRLPITPSKKPFVIDDTQVVAPPERRDSPQAGPSFSREGSPATSTPTQQSKAFVRTHRRTGSHGTPPVVASQQPFVPGHRRTGSHGNVSGIIAIDPSCIELNGSLLRMTTAPGNLDDLSNSLSAPNNAARSVSWTQGFTASGADHNWNPAQDAKFGSSEEIGDGQSIINLIDPQFRPLPPCPTSAESVEIYHKHCQLLDDYVKLQAEVALFERRKQQLLNELQVNEGEYINRMKQEYDVLLTDNEQLKMLHKNLKKQLEQIHR